MVTSDRPLGIATQPVFRASGTRRESPEGGQMARQIFGWRRCKAITLGQGGAEGGERQRLSARL